MFIQPNPADEFSASHRRTLQPVTDTPCSTDSTVQVWSRYGVCGAARSATDQTNRKQGAEHDVIKIGYFQEFPYQLSVGIREYK